MVTTLAAGPRGREELLAALGLGLRTFYRELELLKRVGIRVKLVDRRYTLQTSAAEAEGRLPFPDPQLSFAEMAELSRCPCEAGRRLAGLLEGVVTHPEASTRRRTGRKSARKGKA